ncbi:MAG TPA: aldose 1-epimerase family protein [Clostridia bacterium]|nr:aldose 1-epimerase family protein [Clostridia bacterium]HUM61473.1 aldose 1-epimerase family protein [Clostridia bacterium]
MIDSFLISAGGFSARILRMGAQLCSFQDAEGREYIWQADPAFWGAHAPILFPITGRLKNGQYFYEGKTYQMQPHGFAKTKNFALEKQSESSVCLVLDADEQTRACYPFDFRLYCRFLLDEKGLRIRREVENAGRKTMYFSIGEHLGFNIRPFGASLEECALFFPQKQVADNWCLTPDGLLSHREPYLKKQSDIALDRTVFQAYNSLVLQGLDAPWAVLRNRNGSKGLRVGIQDFPVLVLWTAAKGGDFLCIEPWYGLPDLSSGSGQLQDKPCILRLEPGMSFAYQIHVEIE